MESLEISTIIDETKNNKNKNNNNNNKNNNNINTKSIKNSVIYPTSPTNCKSYSLNYGMFDPEHSSPPNNFMDKLCHRMNIYYDEPLTNKKSINRVTE